MLCEKINNFFKFLAKLILLLVNLIIYTFVAFAIYETTDHYKEKERTKWTPIAAKISQIHVENVACRGGSSDYKKCYRPILKTQYLFNGNIYNTEINLTTQNYKDLAENIAKNYSVGQDFQIFRKDNVNRIITAEKYYNKYYGSSKPGLVKLLVVFIIFVPALISVFFFYKYSDKEAA
jgi:hypothetical protein